MCVWVAAEDLAIDPSVGWVCPSAEAAGIDVRTEAEKRLMRRPVSYAVEVYEWLR